MKRTLSTILVMIMVFSVMTSTLANAETSIEREFIFYSITVEQGNIYLNTTTNQSYPLAQNAIFSLNGIPTILRDILLGDLIYLTFRDNLVSSVRAYRGTLPSNVFEEVVVEQTINTQEIVIAPTQPSLQVVSEEERQIITGDFKVNLNGEYLEFDQPPVMVNNRIFVPLRVIFEALGADVEFDFSPLDESINITADLPNIRLAFGNWTGEWQYSLIEIFGRRICEFLGDEYIIFGEHLSYGTLGIDEQPTFLNDRTLIPVRFVSETLGANVEWDGANQTVIIEIEEAFLKGFPFDVISVMENWHIRQLYEHQDWISSIEFGNDGRPAFAYGRPFGWDMSPYDYRDIRDGQWGNATVMAILIINYYIEPFDLDCTQSKVEVIKFLHDWIMNNATYDTDNLRREDIIYNRAEGVLLRGIGACDSYTMALQSMLGLLGIRNYRVTAMRALECGGRVGHSWNLVELDNRFYAIDATWNNSLGERRGRLDYTHFLIGRNTLDITHREYNLDQTILFGPSVRDLNISNTDFDISFLGIRR